MSTITPILDSLLHQVHGRRAAVERFAAKQNSAPLSAIAAVKGLRDGAEAETEDHPRASLGASKNAAAGVRHNPAPGAYARVIGTPGLAGTASTAVPESLNVSLEGRLISALLRAGEGDAARLPISGTPLWSNGAPSPSILAGMLGTQIGQSGLFYESHLRQWVQGKRSVQQIRAEPQARLDHPTAGRESSEALASGLIDERTQTLIRQQLDTLASAAVRWQGEAWPGAPMHWEIEPGDPDVDAESTHAPSDEAAGAATTRIRLELPRLGDIELRLSLTGRRLLLHAWAAREGTRQAMAPETDTLRNRLAEAGFPSPRVELLADSER